MTVPTNIMPLLDQGSHIRDHLLLLITYIRGERSKLFTVLKYVGARGVTLLEDAAEHPLVKKQNVFRPPILHVKP